MVAISKKEIENMTFEEQMDWALENTDCITTEDILKDYAIQLIEDDNFGLAIHILAAIWDNPYHTTYYRYDYTMGTLETPSPIADSEDIEDLIEDLFDFEEDL